MIFILKVGLRNQFDLWITQKKVTIMLCYVKDFAPNKYRLAPNEQGMIKKVLKKVDPNFNLQPDPNFNNRYALTNGETIFGHVILTNRDNYPEIELSISAWSQDHNIGKYYLAGYHLGQILPQIRQPQLITTGYAKVK